MNADVTNAFSAMVGAPLPCKLVPRTETTQYLKKLHELQVNMNICDYLRSSAVVCTAPLLLLELRHRPE
jgi:hypothetical protein